MREIKAKDISRMYGQKIKNTMSKKTDETKLTVTKDMVLIETKGQKQAVPSMIAFTKLIHEYEALRGNHNKAVKELGVLRESVKILITTVNQMNEELKNKIDKLDD